MVKGAKIAARSRDGFRRCNHAWTREGEIIVAGQFTAAELTRLQDEPNLVVTEPVEIEELKDATAANLKAFAETRGIDLGKATKKEEIEQLLQTPKADDEAGSDNAGADEDEGASGSGEA